MGLETLTDQRIKELLSIPKRVENPLARERTEGKHLRRDFRLTSVDGDHSFSVFTRQSTKIAEGFSAGLIWHSKTGEDVTLLRCNGSDHVHPNAIERTRIEHQCHVHIATERYIAANRKVEGYAELDQSYRTLPGALHHLTKLGNIKGLQTQPDESDLFEQL